MSPNSDSAATVVHHLKEMNRRSCGTQPSARREKVVSLRIEHHIVIAAANKHSLEKHGWQQTVFMMLLEALPNDHRRHERDLAADKVADLHNLRRHDGKEPVRVGRVASLQNGGVHQCLDFRLLAARIQDRSVTAGIEL